MSEEEMRNTIKDQLKQLSKEQLIDGKIMIRVITPIINQGQIRVITRAHGCINDKCFK